MHHQQSLGNGDLLEFQKVPPPQNKYMYKDLQIITGFLKQEKLNGQTEDRSEQVPPPKNKYMHKDLQIITGFCETADGC